MADEVVHAYEVEVRWSGNLGEGTEDYRAYSRDHVIAIGGKPAIYGSAEPAFRGDPARHNPEELLVASISACHMLWYLHLCADAGITVTDYRDAATGTMQVDPDGGGHFTGVVLRPDVTITEHEKIEAATALHEQAHRKCFVTNSVNFPVSARPTSQVEE